jgi:ParB family chromosome partitioning protein
MAQLELVIRNEDPDALAIGELYRKARASVADSVRYLVEVGQRLIAKKDSLRRGEWLPWLEANADVLGFDTRMTASRLMRIAEKCNAGVTFGEEEALQISREIWGHNVRGTQGTGENEWFTPPKYVELARDVLGAIDLDPATHEAAQAVIKAARYFTKTDDGLAQEWHGRVWLNPPYSEIEDWVVKMLAERAVGRVTAGIMLTHNYADTAWFQDALAAVDAVCFKRRRVEFYKVDGTTANPTQGQTFFYFGDETDKFLRTFRAIGSASLWNG